jgi:hypothetical protein
MSQLRSPYGKSQAVALFRSFLPSFRRKPDPVLVLKCRASTRPLGERVTFFTPGILPSAATRPALPFAPLLRRSACAKKGNQRNTPRWRALRASCPASARGCYGVRRMYVRGHSANGRTSCAASFGLILRTLAAPQGPRWGGILPQKPRLAPTTCICIPRRSAGMHGFVDQRRRSRCRASQPAPENARRVAAMDRRDCESVQGRTV